MKSTLFARLKAFFYFRDRSFSTRIAQGIIAIVDSLTLSCVGFLIYFYYVGWSKDDYPVYLLVLMFFSFLMIIAFFFSKLYEVEPLPKPKRQIIKVINILTILFLLLIVFLFAFKISIHFSRVWLFSWYVISTLSICIERTLFYYLLRKYAQAGQFTRNAVIFGAGNLAIKFVREIEKEDYPWVRISGCFDDRLERSPSSIEEYPVLGNLNSLTQFIRKNRCDEVLITLPWIAEDRIRDIVVQLQVFPVTVRLVPELVGFEFRESYYKNFSGVPVLTILNQPLSDWAFVLKWIEDRVVALFSLILLLPFITIIGLLVKLDSPGPVFFRQLRYGFNNRLINVYKFRTLYADQQDNDAQLLVVPNDPRVTRLGAFLRRTSLDELPQLFNVLTGDMSIVGPRPHALQANAAGKLYEDTVFQYATRHKVKPGITGWAQVNGWRGETDTKEKIIKRVEFDLYYIENWTLGFDLVIILRTFGILFIKQNAF